MPKFFIDPSDIIDRTITIKGETAHHLINVLRIKTGDKITLCNGIGLDYNAIVINSIKHRQHPSIMLSINETFTSATESNVNITLYQSLPKGDKLELIIQKCVELGVCKIVPVLTMRSEVQLKDVMRKMERLQRIANSAAEQSMRGIIPEITSPTSFDAALSQMDSCTLKLVAYECEQNLTLKRALSNTCNMKLSIWVGPEGGFDTSEISKLKSHGTIAVSLGKRILRVETAAIAITAQTLCLLEE